MSGKLVAALVVLLLALGGGALLLKQRGDAQRPASVAALGQPVLKSLKAADIAAIAIREGSTTLTLELKDGAWRIAERGGFPADADKVRDLVLKAIELKVGQSEPIGEADRARLKLDGSGTTLEFRGDGGDREFFAESGEQTEAMLAASRVNYRVVRDIGQLKPAIRDGLRWMDFAMRPYAVVPGYELTRLDRGSDPGRR